VLLPSPNWSASTPEDDPIAARLFLNEPAILQWLVREAPEAPVLPVLETGTWRQRPFFTQQLLAGWPLEAALREHPILNSASAVKVIEGCLQFLELLHGAGVVHGDVSPDNIFIETNAGIPADGRLPETLSIRLVDFNSACRFEVPQALPEKLLLKPPYAAPELALGQAISPSTDLWFAKSLCPALKGFHPAWRKGKRETSSLNTLVRIAARPFPPLALGTLKR
jgi:serine/threonine protein kinase